MVGLREAETAEPLARGELGQKFLALLRRSVGMDRMHDERALHAEQRAIARIDALELARYQPVGDMRETRAAVALGKRCAEKPPLAHAADDRAVETLMPEIVAHARHQLLVAKAPRLIADQALVVRKLPLQEKRVGPVELRICHRFILIGLEELQHSLLVQAVANRGVMVAARHDHRAPAREGVRQRLWPT